MRYGEILVRLKLRIDDALRNCPTLWRLHGVALALKSLAQSQIEERLITLAEAYRRWPSKTIRKLLAPWLTRERAAIWRDKRIDWMRYKEHLASSMLTKSLILKAPAANGEKGVLYMSFAYNWLRLVQHSNVRNLLNDYLLVGASSWSPPHFPAHWALAHIGPDPVFMQISNSSDMELYQQFELNIRPIPIMASDWINPDLYQPKPHSEREIDLLMVAGWTRPKRHWLLFGALRKMRRNIRVVLIGQDGDGRSANDVLLEAKAFGVAERIEIVRDASIDEVTRYQCNSKASVILSAREGSCVAVAESLFADTPVAMMYGAHVGALAYINAQTGVLLRPDTMHIQISDLIERSASFTPRAWARANITNSHAMAKLTNILRDYNRQRGLPWTRELASMCWRPDPIYVNESDRHSMRPAYENMLNQHGIAIAGH
jgi:glycosyltransferase involved in cell wall biosynthesis